MRSICLGLEYLLEETDYRRRDESPSRRIRPDAIPAYRARCANLAAALDGTPHDGAPAIRRWLEAARVDPLPELRRAVDPSS